MRQFEPLRDLAPITLIATNRVESQDAGLASGILNTAQQEKITAGVNRRFKEFIWLMGADNLVQFDQWRGWRRIAREVPIAVIARPGYESAARAAPAMSDRS